MGGRFLWFCCFRAGGRGRGTSVVAVVPGPGWVVLRVGACFPWLARAVTLAALAWWCQSWSVDPMTSRASAGPGRDCVVSLSGENLPEGSHLALRFGRGGYPSVMVAAAKDGLAC